MKTTIKKMKLADLIPTENNPRQIKKDDFERLKKSVKSFPQMLDIREIVVDENNRILGGHQRVKALMANGEKEVNVKVVEGLSEEEKREFIVRDNIQNGDWDFDVLANEWSDLDLQDWGILPELSDDIGGEFDEMTTSQTFLKVGGLKIPVTEQEVELLASAYEKYTESSQVAYGFINSLFEHD